MAKVYHVSLTGAERESLTQLIRRGKPSARKVTRARILMLADANKTDEEIKAVMQTSVATICRTRKHFVEKGLTAALEERPRSGAPRRLDGKQEAYLIALACSKPPTGREHWTLRLLTDRLVELQVVDRISDETVRLRLKKAQLNLG